jgi:hypothetical protein
MTKRRKFPDFVSKKRKFLKIGGASHLPYPLPPVGPALDKRLDVAEQFKLTRFKQREVIVECGKEAEIFFILLNGKTNRIVFSLK